MKGLIKIILIIAGTVSIILGIIGIFLPILPTTPLLLLGAAAYLKSSERLYKWLIKNKVVGTYIENYSSKKEIPVKTKIISISLLWISTFYSIYILSGLYLKIGLVIVAIAVTRHILSFKSSVNNDLN